MIPPVMEVATQVLILLRSTVSGSVWLLFQSQRMPSLLTLQWVVFLRNTMCCPSRPVHSLQWFLLPMAALVGFGSFKQSEPSPSTASIDCLCSSGTCRNTGWMIWILKREGKACIFPCCRTMVSSSPPPSYLSWQVNTISDLRNHRTYFLKQGKPKRITCSFPNTSNEHLLLFHLPVSNLFDFINIYN